MAKYFNTLMTWGKTKTEDGPYYRGLDAKRQSLGKTLARVRVLLLYSMRQFGGLEISLSQMTCLRSNLSSLLEAKIAAREAASMSDASPSFLLFNTGKGAELLAFGLCEN